MKDYKNLTEWCVEYSKKTSIKIYPQSAPLQLVIEDMLGELKLLDARIAAMRDYNENILAIYDSLNERLTAIEEALTPNTLKALENLLPKEKPKKREKT